jgi:REP element-mobilizing transposase RayT
MGTAHHRLPRDRYKGRVSAAFTLCVRDRRLLFVEPYIVRSFVDFLKQVAEKRIFNVVFCFMPDHAHLISLGTNDESDLILGLEEFKQVTGHWLGANHPEFKWQKSFYDRVIRSTEELAATVRYVLDNPVRAGLVSNWFEYPYTGAVGFDLNTFLDELRPY